MHFNPGLLSPTQILAPSIFFFTQKCSDIFFFHFIIIQLPKFLIFTIFPNVIKRPKPIKQCIVNASHGVCSWELCWVPKTHR